jgi:hypothetical protein
MSGPRARRDVDQEFLPELLTPEIPASLQGLLLFRVIVVSDMSGPNFAAVSSRNKFGGRFG